MEGGEKKEEASLPPDYVSLAQLQERWLQKQEEMKRKQKQEEEEKKKPLKLKQEVDEKRERDARAQNEGNRNQREGAKMAGGFVRATGVNQEKGKGKELVLGGAGDGGENNKKIGKNGKKRKKFRAHKPVAEKEKVEAEAEVLSSRGAGILSGEGGSGRGSSGVEVGCVRVVEVLPRNGEIARVNGTDLRDGFKKNGRGKDSPRLNELKQSEVAIDLYKEEGVKGGGKKWKGNGRGRGSERGGERSVDRRRGSELKQSEGAVDLEEEGEREGGKKWNGNGRGSERAGEGGSERDVDRRRVSELKQSEVAVDLENEEGEKGGGKKGSGSEIGGERGREWGRRGSEEEGKEGGERERWRERGGCRWRGGGRGGGRGKIGGDMRRKINMLEVYRPVVLEGHEVDLKLGNKADQDEISEVCSEIACLSVEDRNEIWGHDAKEDGAEGEDSDSDKVAVEIEKKVDHRPLARKGENRGSCTGYRAIGIQERDNKAKEDGVEGEGSNGEIVAVEHEKKVDHKVLPRKGENRGYRANGIRGLDNKAQEEGVEEEGSDSDKVAVEIEKKVSYKVSAKNGQKRGFGRVNPANKRWNGGFGREAPANERWSGGFGRGNPANKRWSGGFGRGRGYKTSEISDDCKMKWVKKENKLDA